MVTVIVYLSTFVMPLHCPLCCTVSDEKFVVILILSQFLNLSDLPLRFSLCLSVF